MKSELGVGLIGAGLIGTVHSVALRQAKEKGGLPVRLVAVADDEKEKADHFQKTFGYEKSYRSAAQLIDDPAVDAVYVCTWTSAHAPLVRMAAEAKKPVFCEKPLAFTAEEAAGMWNEVSHAGVVHQVGLVLRQGPIWNVLQEEMERQDLGFPIAFTFRDDQCFPIKGGHPSTWRKDCTRAGHGTLIEHSIHDLDLVEWMLGPVDEIRAATWCRFGYHEIEDMAKVELNLKSGMHGTMLSIWHDVLNRHSNRRLEVFHEKAYHAIECEFCGPLTVMEGEEQGERMISEAEINRRFWARRGIADEGLQRLSTEFGAYEDYLFCLGAMEGRQLGPGFEVAVRAHELVDACYKSAETGEWVRTARK